MNELVDLWCTPNYQCLESFSDLNIIHKTHPPPKWLGAGLYVAELPTECSEVAQTIS